MTKIFVSYRRDDSADIAGRIYDRLIAKFGRENVFKDVDSIPFGVNFKKHLEGVVQQCAVELVLIGKQWLDITDADGHRRLDDPRDFVRIEIESALARDIPVIPLLVSGASMPPESRLPPSLVELTYRNGTAVRRDPDFHTDMDRLIASLQQWLSGTIATVTPTAAPVQVAVPQAPAAPPKPKFKLAMLEWINIPAGEVTLEGRAEVYTVEPFAIAKYPVTNAQFQAFIDNGGYREDRYWQGQRETVSEKPSWRHTTHPRETVNSYEAMAFCRWLSEISGLPVSLPTEIQWQWAAVGNKGWAYPYGNSFDKNKSNTSESGIGETTPVDRYPQGASPFGVMDMSGNVWEWCLSKYSDIFKNDYDRSDSNVVRGGSFDDLSEWAMARPGVDNRNYFDYSLRLPNLGFRVVCLDHVT